MRLWTSAAMAVFAVFFQQTVVDLVAVKGIGPDLLLCATLFLSVTEKAPEPFIGVCVLAAILQELCFSLYTGPEAAAVFLVGVTSAGAAAAFNRERLLFWIALAVAETLLYNFTIWGVGYFLGSPYKLSYVLMLQPAFILYNLVPVMFLYKIAKRKGRYLR